MNCVNCKPLLLLLALLLSLSTMFGQQAKDTVYLDKDFLFAKACGVYYRICVLNKVDNIFYKGKVEDIFIDGGLKMTAITQTRELRTVICFLTGL
jgi:hypothetical protein